MNLKFEGLTALSRGKVPQVTDEGRSMKKAHLTPARRLGIGAAVSVMALVALLAGMIPVAWGGAGDPCSRQSSSIGGFLRGTGGRDTLTGRDISEVITGLGGGDVIFGCGGNDQIYGGSGADHINGGSGNDTLFGGGGNDDLVGGPGFDIAIGGSGTDICDAEIEIGCEDPGPQPTTTINT